MTQLPFSPACERNQAPIAAELARLLPRPGEGCCRVLEIGSGTGQHAVYFQQNLPWLHWQASDVPGNLPDLKARFALEGQGNLASPLPLQLGHDDWPDARFDAVFTANTLHIMPFELAPKLFSGAASVLGAGGLLLVYGPFSEAGQHSADSNRAFDLSLRARDPRMGIRDLQSLRSMAQSAGFEQVDTIAMPANNQLLHFKKKMERHDLG